MMFDPNSPRESFVAPPSRYEDDPTPNQSTAHLNEKYQFGGVSRPSSTIPVSPSREQFEVIDSTGADHRYKSYDAGIVPRPLHERGGSKRKWWLIGAVVVVAAAAIAIPVALVLKNKNKNSDGSSGSTGGGSGGGGSGGGGGGGGGQKNPITGGNGSTVTTSDGSKFTYVNNFGGFWVEDPNDPYGDGAQCNSWTPALNGTWTWGTNKINGVNLGGWFVLEPFITPDLYQKYQTTTPQAVDEWTLSQAMAADTAGGGINQLETHYDTFITEQDIAQIAGAGLNYVRVPIPFWAMNSWDGEPFLQQTCWKYILRLFGWARKYGIRINIDLHTIPGSQNTYNHSGKAGQINFLVGVMGYANAQRALEYIRTIGEFISQKQYQNLIPLFSIVNEPLVGTIGKDQISSFYFQAYHMLRSITGFGAGNGPFIVMHDGFQPIAQWAGFFPGADRLILDTHPYFAFDGQPNTEPVEEWAGLACTRFGPGTGDSQTAFGITIAGEFSNGYNDCGFYLIGPSNTHNYPGDCSVWQDSSQWNSSVKTGLKNFAMASMDSLQNWFFWTWKIGNMTSGTVGAPLWSYQAGLDGGWMPTDPRQANGLCASLGGGSNTFTGPYAASATGGGDGSLPAAVTQSFGVWPPTNLQGVAAQINVVPTYTATVSAYTLPPPSFSPAPPKSVSLADGWANDADSTGSVTTVSGCTYPDAWDTAAQTMPAAACTGAPAKARMARAVITPAPL